MTTEVLGKAEIVKFLALHLAVIRGHVSVIQFLLEHGADVSLRKRLGLTPMHVVAQSPHTDIVQVLSEHGADREAPDDKGNTPLDWAIAFGSGVMVQAPLEHGAVLRNRDADGETPMERAVKGWDVLKNDVLAAFSDKPEGHAKGDDFVRNAEKPNKGQEYRFIRYRKG